MKTSQEKEMACLGNEISQLWNALQLKTDTQKVENLVILNVVDTLAKNKQTNKQTNKKQTNKQTGKDVTEEDPPFNVCIVLMKFKGQVFCLVVHVVW